MSFEAVGLGRAEAPGLACAVSVPDVFVDSARGRKLHKDTSKDAARVSLQYHNAFFMPRHFESSNRQAYGHKQRSEAWNRIKSYKFHSWVDLVAEGKSRAAITGSSPKVQFAQKQADGDVYAYMRYRWPHPTPNTQSGTRGGVTQGDMNAELTRFKEEEISQMGDVYGRSWISFYQKELALRPKLKKQIGPKLEGL